MVDALHTPGPWIIKDGDWLQSERGPIVDGRYFSICVTTVSEADRALILAAPDLLAACERALNFIGNTEDEFGENLPSGDALRAAIAKATATPSTGEA